MKHHSRIKLCAALTVAALVSSSPAGQVFWTGNANNDEWSNAGNWNTNGVPGASDDVTFGIAGEPRLFQDHSVRTLNFQADTSIRQSSAAGQPARVLTVTGGGITVGSSAGPFVMFSPNLRITSNTTINVASGRHLIFYGGLAYGSTPRTLTKTGTGTMTLYQTSGMPLNGDLNINAGDARSGGITGTGTITVGPSAQLAADGVVHNPVRVSGNGLGGTAGSGILANGLYAGRVTLTGSAMLGTIYVDGGIHESGGSFGITVASDRTLNLRSAGTYTGGTTLNGNGTISLRHAQGMGTGKVVVDAAADRRARLHIDTTLQAPVTNAFELKGLGYHYGDSLYAGAVSTGTYVHAEIAGTATLMGDTGVYVGSASTLTFSGPVTHGGGSSDNSGLQKFGPGTVRLTYAGNTNRALRAADGVIEVIGSGAMPSSFVSTASGGSVLLDNVNTTVGISLTGMGHESLGTLRARGSNSVANVGLNGNFDTPLSDIALAVDAGGTLTVNGNLTATPQFPISLHKLGPGTLILNGLNESNRDIHLRGGTLSISQDHQLGKKLDNVVYGTGNSTLLVRDSLSTARTFDFTQSSIRVEAGETLTFAGVVNGPTLRGPGAFALADGATAANVRTLVGTQVTQSGTVVVSDLHNAGTLSNLSGMLTLDGGTNSGAFRVHAAAQVAGLLNQGLIEVHTGASLHNASSGLLSIGGSRIDVRAGGSIDLGGQSLQLAGGLLTNNGTIGNGTIIADYGSTIRGAGLFEASIELTNGAVLEPGNSPGEVLVQSLHMDGSSRIAIELASQLLIDRVTAVGEVSLAGTLDLRLLNGYQPAMLTPQVIISGSIVGVFDEIDGQMLSPDRWLAVTYSGDTVSVTAAEPGDANLDGTVNFFDLLAVAQNFGKGHGTTWAQGDFNADGQIAFDDLLQLAQRYDASSGAGVSASLVHDWTSAGLLVPEPASVLCPALLLVLARRRSM